jgi:hypothetical protein
VLDVPKAQRPDAAACVEEFSKFFASVSGDPAFSFADGSIARSEGTCSSGARSKTDLPQWQYMTELIDDTTWETALDPTKSLGRSHNPQAGGKLLSNACGMGPGSTCTNNPHHLAFAFSPWVRGVMHEMYVVCLNPPFVFILSSTQSVWM